MLFVTCRNVGAMEVFALPKDKRALVAGVLLSAVKIERVEKQVRYCYYNLNAGMLMDSGL